MEGAIIKFENTHYEVVVLCSSMDIAEITKQQIKNELGITTHIQRICNSIEVS